MWTAAAAGGGASGWLLGGVITEQAGWPWVFLVNVPIAVAAFALAPLARTGDARRGPRRSLDTAGAATLTGGLALLVLGLTRAQIDGAGSPLAAGGTVAGVALLALFIRIEARAADPLLPAALLRADGLAGANLAAAAITASTTPPLLLCVLALQGAHGHSALATGVLFAPFNVAVIGGSLLGARAVRAIGTRAAMTGGLGGIAAGVLGMLAFGGPDAAPAVLLVAFVVMGFSLGCASVASTTAGTAAAGRAREGVASALLNTAAQVGTALGVAVLISVAATAGSRARVRGRDRGRPGRRARRRCARLSCRAESIRHSRGGLSSRQRWTFAPWRIRPSETWSNVTSTTSSGRSMTHSRSRPIVQRDGSPRAALAGLVRRELVRRARASPWR